MLEIIITFGTIFFSLLCLYEACRKWRLLWDLFHHYKIGLMAIPILLLLFVTGKFEIFTYSAVLLLLLVIINGIHLMFFRSDLRIITVGLLVVIIPILFSVIILGALVAFS